MYHYIASSESGHPPPISTSGKPDLRIAIPTPLHASGPSSAYQPRARRTVQSGVHPAIGSPLPPFNSSQPPHQPEMEEYGPPRPPLHSEAMHSESRRSSGDVRGLADPVRATPTGPRMSGTKGSPIFGKQSRPPLAHDRWPDVGMMGSELDWRQDGRYPPSSGSIPAPTSSAERFPNRTSSSIHQQRHSNAERVALDKMVKEKALKADIQKGMDSGVQPTGEDHGRKRKADFEWMVEQLLRWDEHALPMWGFVHLKTLVSRTLLDILRFCS